MIVKEWTLEIINGLVKNQVEEGTQLEYKGSKGIEDKLQISKSVSAMANSIGGTIIYGVKEFDEKTKRQFPERIDPVDRIQYTKEWLEQIIDSWIQPRIDGLKITPIIVDQSGKGIYVVDIPQSTTAHQASDKIYYKRRNFQNVPMEDYEIRDVMGRSKYPDISLSFELKSTLRRDFSQPGVKHNPEINLFVYLVNNGSVLANYCNYALTLVPGMIPKHLESFYEIKVDGNDLLLYGENTKRDEMSIELSWGSTPPNPIAGPVRYIPILPGRTFRTSNGIVLDNEMVHFGLNAFVLKWEVFADNAPRKVGEVEFKSIRHII